MIQGQLAICDLKYGSPEESYNKPIGSISLQNRFDLPWGIYAYLTDGGRAKAITTLIICTTTPRCMFIC